MGRGLTIQTNAPHIAAAPRARAGRSQWVGHGRSRRAARVMRATICVALQASGVPTCVSHASPLCHWPESLAALASGDLRLTPSAGTAVPLSRVLVERTVRVPESFRGGCSFGGRQMPTLSRSSISPDDRHFTANLRAIASDRRIAAMPPVNARKAEGPFGCRADERSRPR